MRTEQLSIFDMQVQAKVIPVVKPKVILPTISTVQDVRTKGQQTNTIAFDVGETIGGSRKDIAQQKLEFLEKPTLNLLHELEETDVSVAAEVIVRKTFFNWFSLEDCRKRGVEPGIAKAIQLFINRIPKSSKDTKEDREKYVNMLIFISELLKTVKTREEYYSFETRVIALLNTPSRTERITKKIEEYTVELSSLVDVELKASKIKAIQEEKARLFLYDLASTMALRDYKGPFRNYFTKGQSRINSLRNSFSVKSWDELIPPLSEKGSVKQRATRKPVWERELPEEPFRSGGQDIVIEDPKTFIGHFGFRASEFGHYVGDEKGKEHLSRSAEAYTDLADILEIPMKAVSLKKELAMAFGARGSGRALGHYEPARKVINLTKERGSLGILAHEWFHGLDHYLFNSSYSFENGKPGYITDNVYGQMSIEVIVSLNDLLDEIKIGDATAFVDVSDSKKTYRLRSPFTDRYELVNGDLHQFMDGIIQSYDRQTERMLSGVVSDRYLKSQREKYAKQRLREIKKNAEALAEYHLKMTGEKVDLIPYTTDRSSFYQHAINMDKGIIGKYWSSNRELAARAFESYIFDELKERNWTSDYLVCGIRDSVFPQGIERDTVFTAMKAFIHAIRPYLTE